MTTTNETGRWVMCRISQLQPSNETLLYVPSTKKMIEET